MRARMVTSRRRFMTSTALGAASLAATAALPAAVGAGGGEREARFAYVGTYTRGAPGGTSGRANSVGIYVFRVSPGTGELSLIQSVPSANPSFVTLDPKERFLYAINEIDDYEGQKTGSVEAYAINAATGRLTFLNRVSSGGPIPAHLAVDPTGRYLVVGNYIGSNYVVLPLQTDGRLSPVSDSFMNTGSGPNKERQEAPHPHATTFDPAGRFIATADLGIDKVQIFRLDTGAGKLVLVDEAAVASGAGPRHVAFHPSGRILYVINELTATITAFAYNAANGNVGDEIQTIGTVPPDFPPHKSTAEIMVDPSGRFLYGSNRKFEEHPLADAIVGYSIDQATGRLTLIGHTTEGIAFPRHFNIDPTGTWLYAANQKGDTIVQFRIDQVTGQLSATGRVAEAPTPVSIAFKTAATTLPGVPNTGAGGGAGADGMRTVLAAAGLGAAALAAFARRRAALAAAPDDGNP